MWITDNGGQFISKFVEKINELTGTKHKRSSLYYPQTQGAVEFTNQELDKKLCFYVSRCQNNWVSYLLSLDFAYNSTYHSAIKITPFEALLGKKPLNPLSWDIDTLNSSPALKLEEMA